MAMLDNEDPGGSAPAGLLDSLRRVLSSVIELAAFGEG